MRRTEFAALVRAGIERIPAKFRPYLDDIAVVIEGEPTPARKRAAGVPPRDELLGVYEGTPHTQRAGLPYRLPDKITLFQGPLERVCHGAAECLRDEVAHTVWHELAHALGLPEGRVRHLERRRRARPSRG